MKLAQVLAVIALAGCGGSTFVSAADPLATPDAGDPETHDAAAETAMPEAAAPDTWTAPVPEAAPTPDTFVATCAEQCSLYQAQNAATVMSAQCQANTCVITACQPNTADCDGNAANGCEIPLGPANCWSCPAQADGPACPCKACPPGAIYGVTCPYCYSGDVCSQSGKHCV